MLLSPTQENLAPQAWAIKRAAHCGEFLLLHRQISRGKPDCEKAESQERNPGISQAGVAFSSSRTTSSSSLLKLNGQTDNYYH